MKGIVYFNRMFRVVAASIVFAGVLLSCTENDIVVTAGSASLEKLIPLFEVSSTQNGFEVRSKGGERFEISSDFSSGTDDLILDVDAAPFLQAGLDAASLSGSQRVEDGRLVVRADAGAEWKGGQAPDFAKAVRRLMQNYRGLFAYHDELDHYLIMVGSGHTWEWAADSKTNSADLVFVLNPEALSGLNPDQVDGWAHKDVTIRDESGRRIIVKRLIKAYDLE